MKKQATKKAQLLHSAIKTAHAKFEEMMLLGVGSADRTTQQFCITVDTNLYTAELAARQLAEYLARIQDT